MVAAPAVRALSCPSCGGAVEIRGFEHTMTVVCPNCLAVLDAKDPGLRVLQRFAERVRVRPLIPLGTRGTLRGDPYEAIGFQERTIRVEGMSYSWREYVLFNPYKGFRYLSEYDGHWNDIVPLRTLPTVAYVAGRPAATVLGETFRHFQTAVARTTFVLGEFPWLVRVGDEAEVRDYVSPPRMLSAETTDDETTWSLGEYTTGAQIWAAFKLPGAPRPARGVFANQPSPHVGGARTIWMLFWLFALVVGVLAAWRFGTARSEEVYAGSFRYAGAPPEQSAFVTEPFTLGGRTANVELAIDADVQNSWLYLGLALINDSTDVAYDFGRQVSYYEGVESGERWTEGSRRDRVRIASVPPGVYYLRVAPEGEPSMREVTYTLRVRRDVPQPAFFLVALLLLVAPPVFASLRAAGFEQRRWAESDYSSGSGGTGEEDDT